MFMLIAEPRVARVIQFGVYLAILGAGLAALVDPPRATVGVLGPALTFLWASFLILGGLLGAVAVLPGIWWLERAAVIATGVGVAMYGVVVLSLQLEPPSGRLTQLAVIVALLLSQAHRWTQIRRYDLAPKG